MVHAVRHRPGEHQQVIPSGCATGAGAGLFADMAAPDRLTPEQVTLERSLGMDPWRRRRAFQRLGYRKVGVGYHLPAVRPGDEPETWLDLIFCPVRTATEFPVALVEANLVAMWTAWLGRRRAAAEWAAMRRQIAGEWVPLLPLTPEGEG